MAQAGACSAAGCTNRDRRGYKPCSTVFMAAGVVLAFNVPIMSVQVCSELGKVDAVEVNGKGAVCRVQRQQAHAASRNHRLCCHTAL